MNRLSTRGRIIQLLRACAPDAVSGEEISRHLQISRAAVWKQIKTLRNAGFSIEALHARGYRLLHSPDALFTTDFPSGINSRILGRSIEVLAQTDSTNLQLKRRAEAGAKEGLVLVADHQLAGRGRLGRSWQSPPEVNLYLSLLLRPDIPVQQAPQLTFLSAVAVATTLADVCGLPAVVKWPNDILIGGSKIAGLLNEVDAETERVNFVVLGIGINLNMTTDQFPGELNYPATSVYLETGQRVDRVRFLQSLVQLLDTYYCEFLEQGFPPIRSRWERFCPIVNRKVSIQTGDVPLQGVVVGLEADGALRLQREDGGIERIVAGDVQIIQ